MRDACPRHHGGDGVGGEGRDPDVLIADDEQHRASGRGQLRWRARPARAEPLAQRWLVEAGIHPVDAALEEMQCRLLRGHARALCHMNAAPVPARGCGLD